MTFSNLSNENMLLFMPPPFCILGRAYQVGHIALLLSVCISVGLLIGRSTNSSLIFFAEVAHTAVLGFASWTQKHYLQFLFNLFAKVALTDTLESFQQSYALWTQEKIEIFAVFVQFRRRRSSYCYDIQYKDLHNTYLDRFRFWLR